MLSRRLAWNERRISEGRSHQPPPPKTSWLTQKRSLNPPRLAKTGLLCEDQRCRPDSQSISPPLSPLKAAPGNDSRPTEARRTTGSKRSKEIRLSSNRATSSKSAPSHLTAKCKNSGGGGGAESKRSASAPPPVRPPPFAPAAQRARIHTSLGPIVRLEGKRHTKISQAHHRARHPTAIGRKSQGGRPPPGEPFIGALPPDERFVSQRAWTDEKPRPTAPFPKIRRHPSRGAS